MTTVLAPPDHSNLTSEQPPAQANRPGLGAEVFLFVGTCAGHLPLLADHFSNLWARSHYQYFPVVLLAIAYLIYDRWRYQREETPDSWRYISATLLVIAIGTLAFASYMWSPTLGSVSFAISCMACLLLVQHKTRIRNWFGIGLLMWLIVPAPMGLDARLSSFLQGITTTASGLLLDLIGVVNVVDGNTLVLSTGRLFVEEACSGIVSLMAVVACSLIIAVWQNRPLIHMIFLVACGIAWAGFMNMMRIVVIGVFMVKVGIDLSTGWQHEVVGLVLFALTLLLTASTDRLIGFIAHPIWSGPEKIAKTDKSLLVRTWNFFSSLGYPSADPEAAEEDSAAEPIVRSYMPGTLPFAFGCSFLLVAMYSGYSYASHSTTGESTVPIQLVERADSLSLQTMPSTIDGWTLVNFDKSRAENRKLFGEYSKLWTYQKDGQTATLAVDYPFNDVWHELCVCYQNIGWELLRRDITQLGKRPIVMAQYHQREEQFGLLYYSMMTSLGRPYDPPSTQSVTSLFKRRLKKGSHRIFQIQLWSTRSSKLSTKQQDELKKLYGGLRAKLARALFAGGNG